MDDEPLSIFSFADLLAPLSLDEFVRANLFREPVLIPGDTDKFARLFTWDTLNRILSQHRLDPTRIRLEKRGATAAELDFTERVPNLRGDPIVRINIERLYERLRDGATLVVDSVDEASPTVRALSEELTDFFTARSVTNLYASFGHVPGFNCHWDSRDVFATQIAGRKYWKVYNPSRRDPLYRDHHESGSEPGELFWEGYVTAGDVLYVPRGWWHEVMATDEQTLHLTIGSSPLTAIDMMSTLVDRMRAYEVCRRNIPRFEGDDQTSYEHELRAIVSDELDRLTVASFLLNARATTRSRTYLSLPFAVDSEQYPLPPGSSVRWSAPSSVIEYGDDAFVVRSGSKEVEVDNAGLPIIRALVATPLRAMSLVQLQEAVPTLPGVDALVHELLTSGLVHLVTDRQSL